MISRRRMMKMQPSRTRIPWYLAGGVPKANCIAAYQAIGAASYAASKVNLVNSATHGLVDTGRIPAWDAVNGWTGAATKALTTDIVPEKTYTLALRYKDLADTGGNNTLSRSFNFANAYFGIDFTSAVGKLLRFVNGKNGEYQEYAGTASAGTAILAERKCYVDGAYMGIIANTTWTAAPPVIIILNRTNYDAPLGGKILAWAIYDITISDATALALHAAMMLLP